MSLFGEWAHLARFQRVRDLVRDLAFPQKRGKPGSMK